MKSIFRTLLRWAGILIFAYYFLPNLRGTAHQLGRPSFSNLARDTAEAPFERPIMEAFEHFPKTETEYYFGDFDDRDLFENHPLIDLLFPRAKNAQARCGFRKWSPTIKRNEQVIYRGAVYVVCRR